MFIWLARIYKLLLRMASAGLSAADTLASCKGMFAITYTVLHIFTQFGMFIMKNAYVPDGGNEGGGPLPLAFQCLIFMV